jgi:N utilization substance protein A
VAREAGSRSKLAVYAADPTIDAVGACVGPRGGRVGAVVEELKGEKMDIVNWSEDPAQFVAAALSPADVVSVTMIPGQKACRVVVPDDQLSLAIGKEGQNARLAARLTGYKIDIKSVSADRDDPLVLPEPMEDDDEDVILLDEENEAVEAAETEEAAAEVVAAVEADEAPAAEE